MANEQNLIPGAHTLTVEEASKGGRKSGEARRRKRTLMEIMNEYGAEMSLEDPKLTNDEKLVVEQYKKAMQEGDTKAAAFIRDTKGEKPHDVVETPNIEVKPLVDLTKRKKNGEKK